MKYIYILTITFILAGCEGENISNSTYTNSSVNKTYNTYASTSDSNDDNIAYNNSKYGKIISPSDINISQAIIDGKVKGYSEDASIKQKYLAVINYYRSLPISCEDDNVANGPVGKVAWNEKLYSAAYDHSLDVIYNFRDFFTKDLKAIVNPHLGSGTETDIEGHQNGNPSTFDERVKAAGYNYPQGENVAVLSTTNPNTNDAWKSVMDSLIRSPHHCVNIMNKNAKDFAMAEYKSGDKIYGMYQYFWTQEFGAREK